MKTMQTAQRLGDWPELIYILTDYSPSMDEEDYQPTRKEGAIKAVKAFIKTKAKHYPKDQVGLICFDSKAHVLSDHQPVGSKCQWLCRSLSGSVDYDPGTNFTAALKLGQQCLMGKESPSVAVKGYLRRLFFDDSPASKKSEGDRQRVTKRLILLSDGQHNGISSPIRVAQQLKDAGVIIECIGIAGDPGEVDARRLKAIASKDAQGRPRYWFIKDTQQLIRQYQSMATHIRAV